MRLIDRELPWPEPLRVIALFLRVLKPSRARLFLSSRNNKMLSNKLFSTSWILRRSRDRLRSNKTKISRRKLLWLREKDSKRRCSPEPELPSSRNFRKKRLLKSLRLREWSKSSLPLRLFKRPRLLLQRKLPLRLTLLDSRESTNFLEERLRLSFRCLRSSSRWKPNRPLNSKRQSLLKSKTTLRSKSNLSRLNRLKLMLSKSKKLPLKLRKRPPRRRLPRRRKWLNKKPLRRKLRLK